MAYDEIVMQDGGQPEGDTPATPPTEGGEGENATPASEGAEETGM
jgi:hypothetical protein